MKKYSGVALHVIVFVFLFIFLRIFSEYHFYCVEQNQLFQLTPIFIIDKLMQPGGLAMVLSGCLVQFFILPNVGAMITAALLTSLGALFWSSVKRIDPRSHGILWAWLPVLSLLFVQWDFNYRFQGTVAFGMMLLALYLVLGIRNFIPRLIASLFASLLLFGLAGPVSCLPCPWSDMRPWAGRPVGIILRFYRWSCWSWVDYVCVTRWSENTALSFYRIVIIISVWSVLRALIRHGIGLLSLLLHHTIF